MPRVKIIVCATNPGDINPRYSFWREEMRPFLGSDEIILGEVFADVPDLPSDEVFRTLKAENLARRRATLVEELLSIDERISALGDQP